MKLYRLRYSPTVVHRMLYEPGREQIMGHVLVPVRTGLVEFRLLAGSRLTGVRESLLVARAIKRGPEAAGAAALQRVVLPPLGF